ncbi:hypothetical protein DNL40_09900 [Xylanimonas oleitrophica]|uniref:EfeO-type cupredoxin-like domain-containing protein n=1 Tax=Xylanimonas oleitrophica TaxID=2607479 RepID=A0A2W5WXD9_9MICO|nr:hypothetical protein [Xylanimonas oleitrophica]PZR52956.1 hypothetical protein DNL40_09900 [Xylanimonas oleitrophica]
MSRRAGAAAVVLAASALTGACADPDAPPPVQVEITSNGFDPVALDVPPGTEVRFVNKDLLPQTVTTAQDADGEPVLPPGAEPFDSGRLSEGVTYAVRLEVPGEYLYESLTQGHGTQMIGSLRVSEDAAPGGTAPAGVPGGPTPGGPAPGDSTPGGTTPGGATPGATPGEEEP